MRYKFSIPPRIRAYVEWQIEHYPEDKLQIEELKRDMIPSPTPGYSESVGNHEARRSTEEVAEKILTSPYIRRLEMSCDAIEKALTNVEELDRQLVRLVYWKREYTPEGAGTVLRISRATAYRRINNVLCLVAAEMGLISAN